MSFRNFAVCLLLSLLSAPSLAVCPARTLTDPSRVKIDNDRVLLVVHASASYDSRYVTKRGVDEAVRFAKHERIPVIYLQDDSGDQYYFMDDCQPTYWVQSAGGEFSFDLSRVRQVYVVGGHLELCLYETLGELVYQWGRAKPADHRITYFMDGIYSNGKFVDPADPFYRDFDRFMGIVSYGRPSGEYWPKLSLLETMGVIVRPENEYEYAKQVLPRWDRSLPPSYRVELRVNQAATRVLRPAQGRTSPSMQFHFVDSALAANLSDCGEYDACDP